MDAEHLLKVSFKSMGVAMRSSMTWNVSSTSLGVAVLVTDPATDLLEEKDLAFPLLESWRVLGFWDFAMVSRMGLFGGKFFERIGCRR